MAMGRMFWMESGYGAMLGFTSSYKVIHLLTPSASMFHP